MAIGVFVRDCTPDELWRLNQWQTRGDVHPFTCPNRGDGNHRSFNGDLGALVATHRGWICIWCDYTQDWAAGEMLGLTGGPIEEDQ